jgi:cytosine/adenosine deaminase-related metal-dependent hydrolase
VDRILLVGSDPVSIEGTEVVDRFGAAEVSSARRLDCSGDYTVVRPGAVNAHTHLYSGLAPLGMPVPKDAPHNFLQILERVWWRLDRALDEASLRASARLYVAEALLAGTTTLFDHHESPNFIEGSLDVLAAAADELGARLVVCYGATERNGGIEEARRGLAECARFVRANKRPLVRGMVGLHASFTVSDDAIREAGVLARELAVPVHVHLAEDAADVADAKQRGYAGPLERLLALDALPRGSILAHGVHLDPTEVKKADELGLWLVQNPRSNEGNRVGYPHALGASRRVAVGTDGYPADMDVEHAALARIAAVHRELMPGDERLRARREGGFLLAGERFPGEVFQPPILPGSVADIIVSEEAHPRHVIVAGRVIVEGGRLLTGDLEAIRAEAREQAARLWSRMDAG